MEHQSKLERLTGIVFGAILLAAIFAAGCSPQGTTVHAEASTETTQTSDTTETIIAAESGETAPEQASAQPTEITSAETDAEPTAASTETVIISPTETPLVETAEPAAETDTLSAVGGTALTTRMHVNMRVCPDLDCAVVASLPADVQIIGLETVEGERYENIALWWKVDNQGREAYIHSRFLK